MSFASALTYDFEVYSAAQEKWLEVSSVSNSKVSNQSHEGSFQDGNGKTQLLHSLNGSSLALPAYCSLFTRKSSNRTGINFLLYSYLILVTRLFLNTN
jgi:seryl-tRNA synthetase